MKNQRGKGNTVAVQRTPEEERRSFIIKAVACVLALVIAAICFSTIAKQCTNITAGLQTIDTNPDEDAMLYASGIVFNYDLEGAGSEIRTLKAEVRNAYSEALSHIYKLLDPVNEYEGYVNLAYINAHMGEEVSISPELYAVLSSAKALTEGGRANIFGGVLYREWQSITVLNDSAEADPLTDPDERQRIDEIARMTADLGNFSLELSEGGRARLTVSEDYIAMMQRLETEAKVLDLGFLREAYELQYTAEELEKAGYNKGFFTTVGGMTYCLSEASGGYIVAYAPRGNAVVDAFKTPVTGGLMCCTLRTFSYGTDDIEFYTVEDEAGGHMRHPYYNLSTGQVNDALLTVMTAAAEGDFASVCAESYYIISSADAGAAAQELAGLASGCHAAYIAADAPDEIIKDTGFDALMPSEGFAVKTAGQ